MVGNHPPFLYGKLAFSENAVRDESPVPDRITLAQMRGARGLLDWSLLDLAKAAGLSVSTVKRMEMTKPQPISECAFAAVRYAFESAGVRFLADEGDGVGVRLRPR